MIVFGRPERQWLAIFGLLGVKLRVHLLTLLRPTATGKYSPEWRAAFEDRIKSNLHDHIHPDIAVIVVAEGPKEYPSVATHNSGKMTPAHHTRASMRHPNAKELLVNGGCPLMRLRCQKRLGLHCQDLVGALDFS